VIEVNVDRQLDGTVAVKLQNECWELNIYASLADLRQLRTIEGRSWRDRQSLAIGRCAGAPVFWCEQDGQVSILVGSDDETWDVAVTVPLATVDDIVTRAEREIEDY
jgi:hypothetical protein